jgi:hypothetical protein
VTAVATAVPLSRLARYVRLVRALIAARDAQDFALKLLPLLAKAGLALPAALLIHRAIGPMSDRRGKYRVLVIRKAVFNEDVLEALRDADDLQLFGVGRAVLKAMAVGVLPRAVCDDATYVTDDPTVEQAKLRYRRLWAATWRRLLLLRRYDAVLTGNWAYWAEREMASALEAMGTPFIVLHKEGIKPPERSKMLRDLFRKTRGHFTGRRVLVYQEDERRHQVEGGISRPDQVRVVGMARMDRVHRWRAAAAAGLVPARAERPTVLVLAFLPNNFLPSYSGIASDLAWNELCLGTCRAVLAVAQADPRIDVVFRPREHERAEAEAWLDRAGERPSNLRVEAKGEVMPFVEASWVVCGHNTTVMLEGLAAGKPVVVPHFGEMLDPRYHGYNVELGEAVEHATSPDDLAARILRHCRQPAPIPAELSAPARAELARWTGNPDGGAGGRVRRAIAEELAGLRQ